MVIVGIDFGTANSTVAYTREGKIAVVEIDQSARSIPSCVAFVAQERLVGASAIHQMTKNSENTIFGVKRLLGCTRKELQRQITHKLLPFALPEVGEEAKIQVQCEGASVTFYPEEIVATIFHRLKEITFRYVEEEISGAVITVPTCFNARQRTAIRHAAEIAEVRLLGLINETTAAAISYGVKMKTDSTRTILVFHLGGGSFDVALVEIRNGEYDIKAAAGSSRLGGEDFTTKLFKECLEIFSQKNNGMHTKDINLRARARLRSACEKAKRDLGIASSASIRVDAFYAGEDFEHLITEREFEEINKHLVEEMRNIIVRVFNDAGSSKKTVDGIIAVGAATRMELANKLFTEYGEGKIQRTINTNEAAALGAAAYAGSLSGAWSHEKLSIHDVLSHSVYYEHDRLFDRGIKLPRELQRKIDISNNRPTSLKLYYRDELSSGQPTQDEHEDDGYEEYEMDGTKRSVDIKFAIDADGQLKVGAGEDEILKSPLRKTTDVETLKNRAIDMRNEEKKAQANLKKLHELEKKAYELQRNARTISGISTNIKNKILNDCNDVIEFIQGLSNPKDEDISYIQSQKLHAIEQEILGKHDGNSASKDSWKPTAARVGKFPESSLQEDQIDTRRPTTIQVECTGNDPQPKPLLSGQTLDDNPQEEQTGVGFEKPDDGTRTTMQTESTEKDGQLKTSAMVPSQISETNRQELKHDGDSESEASCKPAETGFEEFPERSPQEDQPNFGTCATTQTESTGSDGQLKTSVLVETNRPESDKQHLKPPQSQDLPRDHIQKKAGVSNTNPTSTTQPCDESASLLQDDEDEHGQSESCWCTIL